MPAAPRFIVSWILVDITKLPRKVSNPEHTDERVTNSDPPVYIRAPNIIKRLMAKSGFSLTGPSRGTDTWSETLETMGAFTLGSPRQSRPRGGMTTYQGLSPCEKLRYVKGGCGGLQIVV